MKELEHNYRISRTTISKTIRIVCAAVWKNLKAVCMPNLTKEDWKKIAKEYKNICNFPNCLGAVDGKHIRIIKSTESGPLFFNYNKYCSLLLLAICDVNYKFIFIDVDAYGKNSDSTTFKNTTFYKKLIDGRLDIPENARLPHSINTPALPHVFIGDEAFQINHFMLRPYGGNNLDKKKRIFNYRLSRARRCSNAPLEYSQISGVFSIGH